MNPINKENPATFSDQIRTMFNDIAPTYDLLNHLMSFGLDVRWRARAIRLLEEKRGGAFLDVATGTGDLAIDALRLRPQTIVATDFATGMLTRFKDKLSHQAVATRIDVVACDALALPFRRSTFDAAMVAFGMRNFNDRARSLHEMHRVLKPGGMVLILELTSPDLPVISWLHDIYSRGILPFLGRLISKHHSAYTYLPLSIAEFPAPEEFLALMKKAGFERTASVRLSLGISTIFLGWKSEAGTS